MEDRDTRIGFVGVGNMGNPMASNLIKAGWKVSVYDADRAKVRAMEERGARGAETLAALAQTSDVVITMLPDGHVVRRVVLGAAPGDDALVGSLAKGACIVDMSSSAPVGTRQLGDELRGRGIDLLDAPVSGGV